ncbi:response regulator transcription factor [Herbaspirillum sp. RV1423]|uniref:response regulator transcription factor n=1 Tax=Herbaspirillum sp. RV1423 TaxID=1443993 RepID=UPI001E438325|nr:response regulator [Herbaspirillum sp. RV1423]
MTTPNIRTIGIVDDDPFVRAAVSSLVRSLGMQARVFASAETFLQERGFDAVDCAITDVQMPGMSGLDLLDQLLSDGCRLPLIFVTAFPEESIRKRALAGGAIGFFSKPFNAGELIGCIERALNQQIRRHDNKERP